MRPCQTHTQSHLRVFSYKPDLKDFDRSARKVPCNTTIIDVFYAIPRIATAAVAN